MTSPSTPEGPGSVCGAPNLPAGFTGTFASRYVDTGELRLHVVTGGDGPPLLLVHGWPQTWYQFRLIMPGLARDFRRIARQAGSARPSRPTRSGTRSSRPRWMPESGAGRARGRLARGSENDDAV